jgi:hypothetical protein
MEVSNPLEDLNKYIQCFVSCLGHLDSSQMKLYETHFLKLEESLKHIYKEESNEEIEAEEMKELLDEKKKLQNKIHEKNEIILKMMEDIRNLLVVIKTTG